MATKTVTMNGAELCVAELGGRNALIVNNTSEVLYASAKSGVVPYADGVLEIKAGTSRGLLDANGTVFLLGNGGRAKLTGAAANVNFNLPSSSADGGGSNQDAENMPFMNGMIGVFLPENADITEGKWHNSAANFQALSRFTTFQPTEKRCIFRHAELPSGNISCPRNRAFST